MKMVDSNNIHQVTMLLSLADEMISEFTREDWMTDEERECAYEAISTICVLMQKKIGVLSDNSREARYAASLLRTQAELTAEFPNASTIPELEWYEKFLRVKP